METCPGCGLRTLVVDNRSPPSVPLLHDGMATRVELDVEVAAYGVEPDERLLITTSLTVALVNSEPGDNLKMILGDMIYRAAQREIERVATPKLTPPKET